MLNPFGEVKRECRSLLIESLEELYGLKINDIELSPPPSLSMGVLGYPVFEVAKRLGKTPSTVAEELASNISKIERFLVSEASVAGQGYVNFQVDFRKLCKLTLNAVFELDDGYGRSDHGRGVKVIVEHTSVNPVHPIHVGGARNAVIGDCLSRLLKKVGYEVSRHFYVDDVGLQVAQAAYGFSKLRTREVKGKPDHYVGFIYAATNCITNITSLKKLIEDLRRRGEDSLAREKLRELDEWVAVAAELRSRDPETFDELLASISKDPEPEGIVNEFVRKYEEGDVQIVKLVRAICDHSLRGFKQTLDRVDIKFDEWDWESEITVWSGLVDEVLSKLDSSDFAFREGGALLLNVQKIAEAYSLKEKFGIKEELPHLTLKRADGTTLYTTRDIAYTLWKFKQAERVINVISIEQKLPQLQLKLALYALNKGNLAENLVHFGYELVSLPGYKMSGRRGRYISFDQVLDEAVYRAYLEVSKRAAHLNEEEKRRIAEDVGVAAVRYALVCVSPLKPITFTWDRVLDFERNSGPFVQYAHARAYNILAKSDVEPKPEINYELLSDEVEKRIILQVACFPEEVLRAAEALRPEIIAEYCSELATTFNIFYDRLPVLSAKPRELKEARLALVKAVRIVLRNSLDILGIKALTRM